jgi:HEPN domain-containing protein
MMPDRAKDWLRQAERDLAQAQDSKAAGRHEWACFACHQAAEKAVKALHLHSGQEVWGHVVAKLIQELPSSAAFPPAMIDKGHALDAFYVAARYPNGHVEGAPSEHYGALQSEEALRYAHEILDLVRTQMA